MAARRPGLPACAYAGLRTDGTEELRLPLLLPHPFRALVRLPPTYLDLPVPSLLAYPLALIYLAHRRGGGNPAPTD